MNNRPEPSIIRVNCAFCGSNAIDIPSLLNGWSRFSPYSIVNLGNAIDPRVRRSAPESVLHEDFVNVLVKSSSTSLSGRKQYIAKRLPIYGNATTSYPGAFA